MMTRQDSVGLSVSLAGVNCICLGLGGLLSYLKLGKVAGHAVFISPAYAALVILCGLLLLAAWIKPRWGKLLGSAVILLISGGYIASHQSVVWDNGHDLSANLMATFVFSSAVLAFFLRERAHQPSWWRPRTDFTIMTISLSLGVAISFLIAVKSIEARANFAEVSARSVALDASIRLERAEAITKRLAKRLGFQFDLLHTEIPQHEFTTFIHEFDFFRAFVLLDGNGQVITIHSDDDLPTDWFTRVVANTLEKHPQQTLKHSHVTVSEPLANGLRKSIIIVLIIIDDAVQATVAALVDLSSVMHWAMRKIEFNGFMQVSYQGSVLFQTSEFVTNGGLAEGTISIPFADTEFELTYLYVPGDALLGTEYWADFVWLTGIVVTFFLIASLHLTRVSKQKAQQLLHNAEHDLLTGLPNRFKLEKLLAHYGESTEAATPLAIVFYQVNGVKLIKDRKS